MSEDIAGTGLTELDEDEETEFVPATASEKGGVGKAVV